MVVREQYFTRSQGIFLVTRKIHIFSPSFKVPNPKIVLKHL